MNRRIYKDEKGLLQIVVTIGLVVLIGSIIVGIIFLVDTSLTAPENRKILNSANIAFGMVTNTELTVSINISNTSMKNAKMVLYFAIVDDTTIIPSDDNTLISMVKTSKHHWIKENNTLDTPTIVSYAFDHSAVFSDYGSSWYAIAVVKITYKTTILFEEAERYEHSVREYSGEFLP